MAVTLTSTGITFSDGSSMSKAATAGGLSYQQFTSSGTWSWSGSGSPSTVLVTGVAGGSTGTPGSTYATGQVGVSGGIAQSIPQNVSGNIGITIGAGGAGAFAINFHSCGYRCHTTNPGANTVVGSLTTFGGQLRLTGYRNNTRTEVGGETNAPVSGAKGGTWGKWGSGGARGFGFADKKSGAGGNGGAYIIW